ncbi:cytochrome P450 9e2-like [Cimex lectularius]|uniref:Cytochrome P450 n=1 Tax=Cimex lectularius TaxID=79782 RepID=A0A8I6S5B0_CIMLE|nr:cytochrome P450 9e2-like [Cimex lectularius]
MLSAILMLAVFAVAIYFWLTRDYDYWKRQGVPCMEPRAPFGNIADLVLMKKTAGEVYRDIYRQFPGMQAGGFFKFFEPTLILRDPELVKAVMVKDFSKFPNNDFQISKEVDPLLAINPFAVQGPEWREIRAIQLPAQSSSKLKVMVPDMINCCTQMIKHIRNNINQSFEAKDISSCYTGDTVAACAFGLKSDAFSKREEAFGAVTSGEVFGANYLANFSILCAMVAPTLGKLLKLRVIHKEVEDYFVKVIAAASEYRIKNGVKRNDFLQQLIDTNTKSVNGKPVYDDVEMAGHCMTFYMDGYETTSILLSFTLYELAAHPEIQETLREEIFAVSADINEFDTTKINRMSYLDNVISESLRLHPPLQSITRVCTQSTSLFASDGKEYKIRKGMSVVIPIYALHTDPEYFEDPEEYRPERFSNDNRDLIRKFTYVPYGEGPRICIGIRFALIQVKLAIISILLNYRIMLRDKLKGPLRLDPMCMFLSTSKDGLWIKFEKLKLNK